MRTEALQMLSTGLSPSEVATRLNINPATVRVWKSRANSDKAKRPSETAIPSPPKVRKPQPEQRSGTFDFGKPEAAATNRNYRSVALVALLIAPTLASVQNAYHVSTQIMGDIFGATCLTVVLSLTALGLVFSGARSWTTMLLAIILIGYESFCNLTRIYSGLMIGGKFGTSEFLGRVCDIFNSGSHYTAICLGGLTALLLAAVQYVSLFELNKQKS